MAQMIDGANDCWRKILTNGVISDFDEEHLDECSCLPVKLTIILYVRTILLLHVLVAIITIPCHAVPSQHTHILCTG